MLYHVDLGLTMKIAKHVNKKACWVESVTVLELVPWIPPQVFHGDYYKPLVCRKTNNNIDNEETQEVLEEIQSDRVILHPGDTFFFKRGPGILIIPFTLCLSSSIRRDNRSSNRSNNTNLTTTLLMCSL